MKTWSDQNNVALSPPCGNDFLVCRHSAGRGEGFYRVKNGYDQAVARGLAYAEYADMVWCETGTPDLEFARTYAEAIQKKYPGRMLAYNCSASFNWQRNLDDATIAKFQREVGTSYFDAMTQVIQGGKSSTTALHGSTEDEQFFDAKSSVKKAA